MATAEVYVNLWVLMHWSTGKCLLNALGRAVKQFAGCLAKEKANVKVQQSCKEGLKHVLWMNDVTVSNRVNFLSCLFQDQESRFQDEDQGALTEDRGALSLAEDWGGTTEDRGGETEDRVLSFYRRIFVQNGVPYKPTKFTVWDT